MVALELDTSLEGPEPKALGRHLAGQADTEALRATVAAEGDFLDRERKAFFAAICGSDADAALPPAGAKKATAPLLAAMTVAQLKVLLKERGLKRSGNKADLVARLEGGTSTKKATAAETKTTKPRKKAKVKKKAAPEMAKGKGKGKGTKRKCGPAPVPDDEAAPPPKTKKAKKTTAKDGRDGDHEHASELEADKAKARRRFYIVTQHMASVTCKNKKGKDGAKTIFTWQGVGDNKFAETVPRLEDSEVARQFFQLTDGLGLEDQPREIEQIELLCTALSLDATLCWNVVHRGRFKNRSPASWLAKAWKKLGKKRR